MTSMAGSEEVRSGDGFFKVMLPKTIQAKKMMIPNKYVREHSEVFLKAEDVNLLVPNGDLWKVGLTKSENDELYLDRNWNEFVEHHSIKKEQFLVFGYKGHSTFNVRIFGASGCEIHYSTQASAPPSLNKKKKIYKGESSNMVTSSKKKHKSLASLYQKNAQQCDDAKNSDDEIGFRMTLVGNRRAFFECMKFRSSFPSFHIVMHDYNFSHKYANLPSAFGRKFLKEAPSSIKLHVSNGREWSVRLNKRTNQQLKYHPFTFGDGWAAFQRENNLKKGDICVVELKEEDVWEVSIFRN